MSELAVPVESCRRAVDQLAGRLPPDFIGEDWYQAWLALMGRGDAFDWRTRTVLAALLPPADQWPDLAPVCSRDADETPADLFLRTVTHQASALARAERSALAGDGMPWRRFVAVQDLRTCPAHSALHGVIRRFDDPFWARIDAEVWWGCRCTSAAMNARTAQRRGFVLPG